MKKKAIKKIDVTIPLDHVNFIKKVAKLTGLTFDQVISVILAAYVIAERGK